MLARTMGAAVKFSVAYFHAVPDDLAPAVLTARRHGMDRALEAVERTTLTSLNDLKCLVILIATDITRSHVPILSQLDAALNATLHNSFGKKLNDAPDCLLPSHSLLIM